MSSPTAKSTTVGSSGIGACRVCRIRVRRYRSAFNPDPVSLARILGLVSRRGDVRESLLPDCDTAIEEGGDAAGSSRLFKRVMAVAVAAFVVGSVGGA
nr:hypothetical protein GZ18C8_29 [uncultured archaeon GZfos18C8]